MSTTILSQLKYGELLAYYKLLYQVRVTPNEPISNILLAVGSDGAMGGKLPVKKGFDLSLIFRSVVISEDSRLKLSSRLDSLLDDSCSSEPDVEVLQQLVKSMLDEHKLPWVVFCNGDAVRFRVSIPSNWEIILDNCGLLDFSNESVVRWWRSLLYKYNESKKVRLKRIGDIGESLTLGFEQNRIGKAGLDHAILVSWAASVDDTLGFDVISAAGDEYAGSLEDEIYIEVKVSERKSADSFSFYLSRNEWESALKYGESYYFYCWTGVKMNGTFDSGPYVFKASQVESLLPQDQDSRGEWRKSRLTVNLTDFNLLCGD